MSRETVAWVTSQPRALSECTSSRWVAMSRCCTTVWMRRCRSDLLIGTRFVVRATGSSFGLAGAQAPAVAAPAAHRKCIEYITPSGNMQAPGPAGVAVAVTA